MDVEENPPERSPPIAKAKDHLWGPRSSEPRPRPLLSRIAPAAYRFTRLPRRAEHLLDFDDLLAVTVGLFQEVRRGARAYAGTFGYVLVDEYQDTNRASTGSSSARRRVRELVRGRRRRPVHLPCEAPTSEHPRLREGLPGREGVPPGAELPLDPDDPDRRERRDPQQPRRKGKDLWTQRGGGAPSASRRRRRARRGQ